MNDTLRRLLIFGAIFGGALAAIQATGGGFLGDNANSADSIGSGDDEPLDGPSSDGATRIKGTGVGTGKGGRYEHVSTGDLGGRSREYVAWEALWNTASPQPSGDPENPILKVDGCSLSFYPPLSDKNPSPRTGDAARRL